MAPPEKTLAMWIVYDHPTDHPDHFVARKWLINSEGQHPTREIIDSITLEGLRAQLPPGLVCLPRDPTDPPKIVEVWL
jgi:hypothetical protein